MHGFSLLLYAVTIPKFHYTTEHVHGQEVSRLTIEAPSIGPFLETYAARDSTNGERTGSEI